MDKSITMKGRTLTAAHWVDAGYTVDGFHAIHTPTITIKPPRRLTAPPLQYDCSGLVIDETCACLGCNKPATRYWGGRPHCQTCMPPILTRRLSK